MWNTAQNTNKFVQTRKTTEDQKKHLLSIAYAKPQIDVKTPWQPTSSLSKFTNKYSHTRERKIYRDNLILLEKMKDIEKNKTNLNPLKQQQSMTQFSSLWKNVNKYKKDVISVENDKLAKRLIQSKSAYGKRMWQTQNKQDQYRNNLKQKNSRFQTNNAYIDYSNLAKQQIPQGSRVFSYKNSGNNATKNSTIDLASTYRDQNNNTSKQYKTFSGFQFALDAQQL